MKLRECHHVYVVELSADVLFEPKFRNANPRTYKATLAAFTEAVALINKDKKWASQVYLDVSGDKKSTLAEIQKQLEDELAEIEKLIAGELAPAPAVDDEPMAAVGQDHVEVHEIVRAAELVEVG